MPTGRGGKSPDSVYDDSLTHSLTHSLTYSLIHSLIHSRPRECRLVDDRGSVTTMADRCPQPLVCLTFLDGSQVNVRPLAQRYGLEAHSVTHPHPHPLSRSSLTRLLAFESDPKVLRTSKQANDPSSSLWWEPCHQLLLTAGNGER
eukprot:GHVU01127708.1.p1 GENE.GHVU01127708.1~~GHVU01127708.1.p1  ORF type:complete len:146 (+),score=1.55 GHVU01127708.1:522-959(+)